MKLNKKLKKLFSVIGKRELLLLSILLLVIATFSTYITRILTVLVFIIISGVSKLYHRFLKSSLGIDLVLFTSIITILIFDNVFLSFLVAWSGLLLADFLASKLSHTSLVSIISLTIVVIIGSFFSGYSLPYAVALVLIYDISSAILYYLMGSPFHRIATFLISHFLWNLFLIISFSNTIKEIVI